MISGILAFIIGALGYRARGGGVDGDIERRLFGDELGTQAGRLIYWVAPASILIAIVAGPGAAMIAFPLLWLGTVPGYFGGYFSLEDKANSTLNNYARLTARGVFIALPLVVGMFIAQRVGFYSGNVPWLAVAAGGMFVPCYLTGVWLSKFEWLHKVWRVVLFNKPSTYGEGLLGGLIMLAIIKGL